MSDPLVEHPAHYQRGGIETIDYIRATLTPEQFEGYCIGNALKYLSRYRDKDGERDLRKAHVYLGWALDERDREREAASRPPVITAEQISKACARELCGMPNMGIDMPNMGCWPWESAP